MRKRYIQKQGVIHTHDIIEIIRVVLNAIITSNIHTYEKKYLHTSQIGDQMTKTIMQYMYKNTWVQKGTDKHRPQDDYIN